MERARARENKLMSEVDDLKQSLNNMNSPTTYSFKENGRYVNKLRKAFYQLLTIGVPCNKASRVVEIIINDLLGAQVTNLPSTSTCQNLLVEAGLICKSQIYDVFSNIMGHGCIAHDGTVKKREDLESFGIHMDDKFVLIGIEKLTSKTHQGIAQALERQLNETEQIAAKILGKENFDRDKWKISWNKINCTISDMARVNYKVNDAIKELLNERYKNNINIPEQSTIKIQSLFCMMHHLSGWADATKDSFGRDKRKKKNDKKKKKMEGDVEMKISDNDEANDDIEEMEEDNDDERCDDVDDTKDEVETKQQNNPIRIKEPLASYKIQLSPSNQKQYMKHAFDAVRECFKFYASNSDYELNKSKEIKYTLYNKNKQEYQEMKEPKESKEEEEAEEEEEEEEEMIDPTKGFKPSVGTRSASSMYNAALLILFMQSARLFFENVVILKGGESELNKFEIEMLKLCKCRQTHLQLLIMSTIYEIFIKPVFMAIKATEEIKTITDAIKLVLFVDQLLHSGQNIIANFIDGMLPTMFEDELSLEEKEFRIFSSKIVNDYLKDDESEGDDYQNNDKPILSKDNHNLSQLLEELYLPIVGKHDQAKWRVLHQEQDINSRLMVENMMRTTLDEIKTLHVRRTNYLREGSKILSLSKKEIEELSCAPVHNDRIEESFGKYSQYHSTARNSNINTKETMVMSQINNLNGYLNELEEKERLNLIIGNAVNWRKEYQQEKAKKYMKLEREKAEIFEKSIENAKLKLSMKHKQEEESLAKTKIPITKQDVELHIGTLRTKKARIEYYKSILDNYKKVDTLKEEIETKLKIKLTWSEGGKTKSEDTFKQCVYSIIDYYQPGQ